MKKTLFFFFSMALALSPVCAQSFNFVYGGDTIADGDTVTFNYGAREHALDIEDGEFVVAFGLFNNTEAALTTQVTITSPDGSGNIFNIMSVCAGMCVEGNVSSPFEVPANGTFENIEAHFTAVPSHIAVGDNTLFRVETGNAAAKDGQAWFYLNIVSNVSTSGIDGTAGDLVLRAYPNPASQQVTVTYNMPEGTTTAELIITNTLGQQVASSNLTASAGTVSVPLQGLTPGLYLYGIRSNGRTLPMHKLIVR